MTSFQSRDDILTLLVHLGYLSYHWPDKTVAIPNKEVSQEYVNAISTMDWNEVIHSVEASRKLLQDLWSMNADAVADGIDRAHREISILQYNDENSLSCTINLAFYFCKGILHNYQRIANRKRICGYLFCAKKTSCGQTGSCNRAEMG